MGQIFFDANTLLEVLLGRRESAAVVALLSEIESRHCISPLTVHLCYHFCLQKGVKPERIADFLENIDILPMDNYVVSLAQRRFDGKDFEDCLQAACAELGKCDAILTLDKNFKKHSGTKLKVQVVGV